MDRVHYQAEAKARRHLLVFRDNGTADNFYGDNLYPRVEDNGTLYIQDGHNSRIAAYPSGFWTRVTPEKDSDKQD